MVSNSNLGQRLRSPGFTISSFTISSFTLIGLVALSRHALWRDEVNPWLIARDSESWWEFWQNIRYEGHPVLWYLCLSGLNALTHSLVSMQIFHLALGVVSISLLWRYSPFRTLEKILFTFGYFPFFEYLIISRNYSFGLLFAFVFCSLFPRRHHSYIPLAITLVFMANSHAYALFIALFLTLMLALELLLDRSHRQRYFKQAGIRDLMVSLLLIAIGYGLAISVISPPSASSLHGGSSLFLAFDLHRLLWAIGRLAGSYFMIVPNSDRWLDLIVMDTLALGLMALVGLRLWKKPWILVFYGFSTIFIMLLFFYLKQLGGYRHFGSLYIILITSLWLAADSPDSTSLGFKLPFKLPLKPHLMATATGLLKPIFTGLLAIHCAVGVVMVGHDMAVPYSGSRATAQYLKQEGLTDELMIASVDSTMAPLSGYLNRKFYYPELQDWGSFTLFRSGRTETPLPQVLDQAIALLRGEKPSITPARDRALLVLNYELDPSLASPQVAALTITPLQQFRRSYIINEQYYLYWISLRSS